MFQAILEALLPFFKQAQHQKRSQKSIDERYGFWHGCNNTVIFYQDESQHHYNNTTIFFQQCNSITTTLQFFPQQSNSITITLVRYHRKDLIFGSFRHVAINIAHLWRKFILLVFKNKYKVLIAGDQIRMDNLNKFLQKI